MPDTGISFWGYLISRERPTQPTPLFKNLLLAIANYAIEHFEPKDAKCLTPKKMSSLYQAVGGDLDELFLQTPPAQLSSIYTTLGCSHSLQPTPGDDFVPPSIPALTPRGFAIWQTIQLLLDPGEHVPYLQEATRKFPLLNPDTGERFPREIPRESFPREPDVETVRWHEEVFAKKTPAAEPAIPVPPPDVVPPPSVVPPEEPWGAYYGEDAYSRSREKRRGRKSRHTSGTGGDNLFPEEVLYSRSAPGPSVSEFVQTSHPHLHTGPTSPVCNSPYCSSDSEGYHTGHRQHSRHGSARAPKSYIYQNGVVTPVPVLHSDPPMSPPMVPVSQHRRSHPNLHAYPTVVVPLQNGQPVPISVSSSYSDLRGEYHAHTHPHPSPTKSSRHRSSSPLRKPRSAPHYYSQPEYSRSRSHSRGAELFSDSEDEIEIVEGGWGSRDEGQRRRRREQRELEREQRERERQRPGENGWGFYADDRNEYGRSGGSTVGGRYGAVGVGLGVDRGTAAAGGYYY